MSNELEFTVALPEVRGYQAPLYDDPARFKITHIARRWGKSSVAIPAGLLGHGPLTDGGGRLRRGAFDGGDVQWVYPSKGMSNGAWRSLKRVLRPLIVDRSERERRLKLVTGGAVIVRSGHDPDALRGPGLDGLILDEAAFMDEQVWKVLRPALADRSGWAWFISSPPVVENWYSQLFDEVLEKGRNDWAAYQRPSSDNPQIPKAEIDQLERELDPETFSREILGILVRGSSSGFNMAWFRDRWQQGDELPVFMRTALSVDASWGSTIEADYSAASLWGKQSAGLRVTPDGIVVPRYRYWLLNMWRDRLPYTDLRATVRNLVKAWDPDYLVVEKASAGFALIDELQRAYKAEHTRTRVEGVAPKGSKLARVDSVKPIMAVDECRIPADNPHLSQWLLEHARFPSAFDSDSDDFVDTSSLALSFLGVPSRTAKGRGG